MNKLIEGESSRIVSVLDEALLSSELLMHLPERDRLDSLSSEFENEGYRNVVHGLEDLRDAERKFIKSKRGTKTEKIDAAILVLQDATRKVCRQLRQDSGAADILIQWSEESRRIAAQQAAALAAEQAFGGGGGAESKTDVDEEKDEAMVESQYFARLVSILKDFKLVTVEQLGTTVEQKAAKGEFYEDIKVRIKQQEAELQNIKADLKLEAVKEKELEEKKATVSKLWTAIQEVRGGYDKEMAHIESSGLEEKNALGKTYEGQKSNAMAKFDKASEEFLQQFVSNADREDQLRKKFNRGLVELNSAIFKYDKDMVEKRHKLDRLSTIYREESERRAELEEYFRKIDRDLANEAEEERLIQEEIDKIKAAQKYKDDAAARIQALYRGNKQRKALKKKKGKKGKKGKKK